MAETSQHFFKLAGDKLPAVVDSDLRSHAHQQPDEQPEQCTVLQYSLTKIRSATVPARSVCLGKQDCPWVIGFTLEDDGRQPGKQWARRWLVGLLRHKTRCHSLTSCCSGIACARQWGSRLQSVWVVEANVQTYQRHRGVRSQSTHWSSARGDVVTSASLSSWAET